MHQIVQRALCDDPREQGDSQVTAEHVYVYITLIQTLQILLNLCDTSKRIDDKFDKVLS